MDELFWAGVIVVVVMAILFAAIGSTLQGGIDSMCVCRDRPQRCPVHSKERS